MNIFVWKLSKIAAQKKVFFLHFFWSSSVFGLFNSLFAPTSRSRMSNILRDSESLVKSNGKKWFNIWKFLFESGLKSPRKFFFFFADFALVHPSMALVLLSASVERCFVSRMRDFCIETGMRFWGFHFLWTTQAFIFSCGPKGWSYQGASCLNGTGHLLCCTYSGIEM